MGSNARGEWATPTFSDGTVMITLLKKIPVSSFLVCSCYFIAGTGTAVSATVDSPDESASFMTVEPEVLDFGQVNESEAQIEVSFTLKNSSRHDINIVGVKTGCGCTSAKVPQSTLKPDAFVSVPVAVNISGRRGKFENDVRIEIAGHNDPIIIPIKGTIVHDMRRLVITPKVASTGLFRPKDTEKKGLFSPCCSMVC
jgi:hypothetical protein